MFVLRCININEDILEVDVYIEAEVEGNNSKLLFKYYK